MEKLPKVIATSVIRSTQQGESHGGVYLVDLESGAVEQVIDWNDSAINWEGRGGDRGLRGIAFHRDRVYIAASDEIFSYDRKFRLVESFRNPNLKHCHEIAISGDVLYLTSTNINAILELDLSTKEFTNGYGIAPNKGLLQRFGLPSKARLHALPFNPRETGTGLAQRDELHINSVSCNGHAIMIAGTQIEALLALSDGELRPYAPLPIGTHNAVLYKNGVLYNDTKSNRVVVANREGEVEQSYPVPEFKDLPGTTIPNDHARQGFARGLCTFGDNYLIGGSSPSTISVYDTVRGERIRSISISNDIRNCIHGLEIWAE